MEETKKLYRSRSDRQVAGVCGGLAEYFNMDVTIIRLIVVLFTILGGPGLLVYIVLAIVVPEEPTVYEKAKREEFLEDD